MTIILVFKIYLAGLVILVVAIGLNMLANALGLATWYSFLAQVTQTGGYPALKNLKAADLLFLILLYPVLLGLSAYLTLFLTTHYLH